MSDSTPFLTLKDNAEDLLITLSGSEPGQPIDFLRDVSKDLVLGLRPKKTGTLRIEADQLFVRIDYGNLFSPEELLRRDKAYSAFPFNVARDDSIATLTPWLQVDVSDTRPLSLQILTVIERLTPKHPDGEIRLTFFERGEEVVHRIFPYRMRELAIALSGPREAVGNQRLYLKTKAQTTFDVEICPSLKTSLFKEIVPHPVLEINFGRVLGLDDVHRVALTPPSDFRATVIPDSRTLVLASEKDTAISVESPIRIPIEIPPFVVPESRPNRTILVRFLTWNIPLATAEFDVSLDHQNRDALATPPVLVMWDDGLPPHFQVDKENQCCKFAISNVRCDRLGNPKTLVTDPWPLDAVNSPVKPRVRLSIPPALQDGMMVDFDSSQEFLAGFKISAISTTNTIWACNTTEGSRCQELHPSGECLHVLDKDEHLIVTIEHIHPKRVGNWSLSVDLLDFAGYRSTTFLLPFKVT